MLEFAPNTNMLEYKDGAYLCNGTKRVEAPLNLETLEEAVRQCPKLQAVSLYDAPFGDQCFPLLAQIPRLNMLALLRGREITGHGLELLKDLPLKDLFLQRTALDDEGLAQAARIGKLENLYIAACRHVTPQGLLAIAWRDKLRVSDTNNQDEAGLAGLFTETERKAYEDARTYKTMKNRIPLDSPELQEPVHALQEFFHDMTRWERMAEEKDQGNQADIDVLFARRVSWTPRPGWRPVNLFWKRGGTYTNYRLVAGERVTKSKFWIYAEADIFYYRYLMRLIDGSWMIDNAQWCQAGRWSFCGL
ncbi:NTF2 fold immunity protein [uncultured Acetatifactor sp.]|uniref:NTF2 fold immunity protein n=1 Tax=uncultured Acetatifactor sp. TaxID=1671927 RepID=UPI00262D1131|nr:NTF2 fold immunity protein [uncultured Acetatifactor sp.]